MMTKLIFYLNLFYPIILNLLMFLMIFFPINKDIHPMLFSLILMIYVIFMVLNIHMISLSWITYFTFLIVIGGLMVIFLYITSLSNNELFKFDEKKMLKFFMKFIIMIMIILILIYYNFFILMDLNWFNNFYNIKNNYFISMNYDSFKGSLFFLMIYLFYSLLCVMNICYLFKLPLRQYYNYV
nr:NADH deshydrogenase subunit 6 [Euceros serricornis]